ncbi:dihydroneopterin aldolase [Lyngbya confervoides]|uniref:7,8-dihydroneopterin aldolase n=1 Tax=Lyngbya confervoides BDU141951 TaxID=1574623 RepID=A0ABD4T4E3_9CYAN|nr:dihydroneopterin aldolase [Lyngbya confervoides]MCM1983459.1 dihydroneopterin aldolase [Lyngbya confervoides BDU141951]
MDKIHIRDIRGYGYVGYFEAEKILGQWFRVHLTLETDLSLAAHSDQIQDTMDYRDIIQRTQHLITSHRSNLIESLALAILDQIFLESPRVQGVTLTLIKEAPPIPNFGGSVAIELTRHRQP